MNYYCGYFRKLFGLGIIFLFVVQTMRAEMVSYAQEPKDSVFTDEAIKSDAELLIGLSQVIERDKARLNNLKQDSINMEPVFQQKSLELFQIEIQLDSLSNTDSSSQQLSMVELRREQLKIVVDFLLERRHAVHQQITILDRKIAKEREAVDFVIKGEATNVLETAEQIRVKERIEHLQDSINLPDSLLQTDENYFTNPNEYNWRITQAKRELELAKARFEVAKKKWIIVEQLLALNQDDFNTVESMLDTVTQHLKRWNNTIDPLEETLASLVRLDTAEQLQEVIQNNIRKTQSLSDSVANMLAADSSVLRNLRIRIARLSDFQDPLSNEVEDAANNIETKNRWLAYLESPFAPHRIYSFVVSTGPRILVIIFILFLVWTAFRWLTYRILKGVVRYGPREGRQERIDTLNRAIRSAITVIMFFVGFLAVLSELGIDVSVLLGGAAVFSLAIAFGAQSLVKDYFSGFMILTENQYRVGNVVKINQVSGVVEDISLRSTVLRDLEGVAHFIPHGEITTVSNLTHGWSRVSLDIGVAYSESVDRVMEVVMEVAHQMREDPEYSKLITAEPEMLGVDALSDSAVIIKLLIKTKALKQWVVKREYLRRLKNQFDQLGIEIPFPHRVIYYQALGKENNQVGKAKSTGKKLSS